MQESYYNNYIQLLDEESILGNNSISTIATVNINFYGELIKVKPLSKN